MGHQPAVERKYKGRNDDSVPINLTISREAAHHLQELAPGPRTHGRLVNQLILDYARITWHQSLREIVRDELRQELRSDVMRELRQELRPEIREGLRRKLRPEVRRELVREHSN